MACWGSSSESIMITESAGDGSRDHRGTGLSKTPGGTSGSCGWGDGSVSGIPLVEIFVDSEGRLRGDDIDRDEVIQVSCNSRSS